MHIDKWAVDTAVGSTRGKEVDFIEGQARSSHMLSMGVTFKDFTIRQPKKSTPLWVLYEVLIVQEHLSNTDRFKRHPRFAVVKRARFWEEATFPALLDTGEKPAAFFVYDELVGETLRQWKREHRSMSDRISICTKLLSVLVLWSQNGFCLSSFDGEQMMVMDGELYLHPMLLAVKREREIRPILEWIYEMLSFRSMSSFENRFPLEGLSIRYAQWIHMILRRNPSVEAVYKSCCIAIRIALDGVRECDQSNWRKHCFGIAYKVIVTIGMISTLSMCFKSRWLDPRAASKERWLATSIGFFLHMRGCLHRMFRILVDGTKKSCWMKALFHPMRPTISNRCSYRPRSICSDEIGRETLLVWFARHLLFRSGWRSIGFACFLESSLRRLWSGTHQCG